MSASGKASRTAWANSARVLDTPPELRRLGLGRLTPVAVSERRHGGGHLGVNSTGKGLGGYQLGDGGVLALRGRASLAIIFDKIHGFLKFGVCSKSGF